MRIAVVGAGGVGGYVGGRTAAAGHDVWFVARGAHLAALQRDGLTVLSPPGDIALPSVNATDDTGRVGAVDYVLLAVKSWHFPAVLGAPAPLIGLETGVVTTQNGVSAPGEVAEVVGRDAVLPGAAMVIAQLDGPGRIRHVDGGRPPATTSPTGAHAPLRTRPRPSSRRRGRPRRFLRRAVPPPGTPPTWRSGPGRPGGP